MARRSSFGFFDFFMRWAFAVVLVLLTYNPTSFNFISWVSANPEGTGWFDWITGPDASLPLMALALVVLIVGWGIYVRATLRGMGYIGVILVLLLLGAFFWVLSSQGWIDLNDPGFVTWLALIACATVLGVGMSWSHIQRRLAGQIDVDEIQT